VDSPQYKVVSHVTPPLAKRFKRSVRYSLLRGVLFFVSRLPLGLAQRAGDALGGLVFHLARKERKKALLSLGRAFPEKSDAQRLALARACFRHLGRCAFEAAVAERLSAAQFDALVEVPEGVRAMLLRAHKKGKGVVAVTGHVGHWELLGWSFVRQGIPLHVIAQQNVDARLTRLSVDFREKGNVHTVLRGVPGAAVGMLRALRRGDALGLLVDQDTRVQSVCVPFFGTLASTPRAPADLALRSGAATVVVFLQRGPDGRYHFSGEELEVVRTGNAEADVVALTRAYSAAIETAVRRAPEQWVWMHQRWKTVC
jgi:Kdo2-lipid IVA lauroyltransferase/acyltransferase